MKQACIEVHGIRAGVLEMTDQGQYRFMYDEDYSGPPVSLTMPVKNKTFDYEQFPPFFDGLLPEGVMLDALLRIHKIDRNDYFAQLLKVGGDLIGAVTVKELK